MHLFASNRLSILVSPKSTENVLKCLDAHTSQAICKHEPLLVHQLPTSCFAWLHSPARLNFLFMGEVLKDLQTKWPRQLQRVGSRWLVGTHFSSHP